MFFYLLLQLRLQVVNLADEILCQPEFVFKNFGTIHSQVLVSIIEVSLMNVHCIKNRFLTIATMIVTILRTIITTIDLLCYYIYSIDGV